MKGKDPSTANGSSIAFIGEYAGKSCVFLGDAHMRVVCQSPRRLGYTASNPLKVDAVNLSHHGSKHNFTPEFLELVDAEHFLFSSNGDRFKHPDAEAVKAVIQGARRRPTLWFNYRSKFSRVWERDSKGTKAKYRTRYPREGAEGILVEL